MADDGTAGGLGDDFEPALGFEYFDDVEAARIVMHPLRKRAYIEAVNGPVSAKDLAERLDVPLQRMSYHVRLLADAGLLRVVRRTQRRGAMETHYRAVATLEFNDSTMARASPETRAWFEQTEIQLIAEDLLHGVARGAAADRDFLVTRAHFVVDDRGRERLGTVLRDVYRRLSDLEQELRVQAGEGAHEVNVVLAQYAGRREAGRNGPALLGLDDTYDTIPP
jgi:DNA-binding transcriptional ArsR family regulator